jgi:hypothetical protein
MTGCSSINSSTCSAVQSMLGTVMTGLGRSMTASSTVDVIRMLAGLRHRSLSMPRSNKIKQQAGVVVVQQDNGTW